jgi:hypothetical protein
MTLRYELLRTQTGALIVIDHQTGEYRDPATDHVVARPMGEMRKPWL